MINRPRINFHVGFPRVAPKLVHEAASAKSVANNEKVKVITRDEHRRIIRPLVNDSSMISYSGGAISPALEEYKQSLSTAELVVASQHSLLGSPEQKIDPRQTLPFASSRLKNLSDIFHEFEISFHIALRSQLSTALMYYREPELRYKASEFLDDAMGWSGFLCSLVEENPDREFVVWDFEDEMSAILPFLSGMFEIDQQSLSEAEVSAIKSAAQPEIALNRIFTFDEKVSEAERREHDELYARDLEEISSPTNVSLVRTGHSS